MLIHSDKKAYVVFSLWLRIFHWLMVLSVTALFWTGLYIGDPGFAGLIGKEPTFAINNWFSMEMIRRIHFIAGFILTFSFIFRIAGAIRNRGDRLMPKFNQKLYWRGLRETTIHYLMLPQKHYDTYLRNSLARTSYMMVYVLFFFEIVTGFAMYAMVEPHSWIAVIFNPINAMIGEYRVHIIHHYIAWIFLLFTVIHVYMAFREDVMEESGEVSSMVTGMKYYAHDPIDMHDIEDEDDVARK
ncbi:hydrogenase [Veillonella montpellierensis DNF00314]|uniref:Hydrogenase n=1 Tax=Veillonella montpellierensis DNF00314 TaxID=1401067 RepID=A0A096ALG0_9FIRM|nr:Ni/Fe-hydrogenase, b-type cytochrome subunit [Veillonella montpellierensis]KGF47913.1 hydrogenase [Veillonella montpellierensis DNF00314]